MLTAPTRAPEIKGPAGYDAGRRDTALSVQERLAEQKRREQQQAEERRVAEQEERHRQAEARRHAEFEAQQQAALRRQADRPQPERQVASQNFPIQSKVRTNSFDPGAPDDSQPYVSSLSPDAIAPSAQPSDRPQLFEPAGEVVDLTAVELQDAQAPRPGRKPLPGVQTAANNPFADDVEFGDDGEDLKGTYIPAKKPAAPKTQLAAQIPSAAPQAVQRAAPQTLAAATKMPVAPPPPAARRARALDAGVLKNAPKVMPAVPSNPVGIETLPPVPGTAVASADDHLLMQLRDFDRDSFVKQVEDLANNDAPKPGKKPARLAKGTMPPPLSKDNKAIISSPAVLAAATATPIDEDLAAITPAAGGKEFATAKIDRTPRPPPPDGTEESAFITLPFLPGDDKATADIRKELDAKVIPLLRSNPDWRVQIQAFSSPDNEVRSSARRTALSRALSVREYLMQKGIEAPRMDVRALGMETDRDPLDRIDMVFFDPASRS
jgi:outer membrane protein OmpA-like peptidoglycan-associated protein